MTPQARFRRIGWLAALSLCLMLYAMLHLGVNGLHSKVMKADARIASLERQNMVLETEIIARSSPLQLAALNRIEFGYTAPEAAQFLGGTRQLAQFGMPRGADAPDPIQLAGMTGEDAPPFPELVSPLTGKPVDDAVLGEPHEDGGHLAVGLAQHTLRVPIAATGE